VKPRQISAPWTEEDSDIVFTRDRPTRWLLALRTSNLTQDIRDAELMYVAQWRWRMGYRQSRPWCPYRGPLEIFDYGQRLLLGGQL
jgi:hypothetical protein